MKCRKLLEAQLSIELSSAVILLSVTCKLTASCSQTLRISAFKVSCQLFSAPKLIHSGTSSRHEKFENRNAWGQQKHVSTLGRCFRGCVNSIAAWMVRNLVNLKKLSKQASKQPRQFAWKACSLWATLCFSVVTHHEDQGNHVCCTPAGCWTSMLGCITHCPMPISHAGLQWTLQPLLQSYLRTYVPT